MTSIPSILQKIVAQKRKEVARLYDSGAARNYEAHARALYSRKTRNFNEAITRDSNGLNLIAEYKKASPSKGDIRPGANPEEIATLYERCGASAISVLTDSHFKGELPYLGKISLATRIPLLRKDFIIDEAQIYESRLHGADAILLIAAILDRQEIRRYIQTARDLQIDCLVESHNEEELERALEGGAEIIGINNRDLNTFKTDLETTVRLARQVPKGLPIVTESGIHAPEDVSRVMVPGVKAMLVGESLMSAELNPALDDIEHQIRRLTGQRV